MARILTSLVLLSVMFIATGCTSAAVAVIDEKVSQMTEKDCTTVNIMLGENYCRDKKLAIKQDPIYCYRTLGGIDCYARKDPYKSKEAPRVREVSELGSEGAKVTYVGQSESNSFWVSWPFGKSDTKTADLGKE
jgi:hypothetical protein